VALHIVDGKTHVESRLLYRIKLSAGKKLFVGIKPWRSSLLGESSMVGEFSALGDVLPWGKLSMEINFSDSEKAFRSWKALW
jgi:hypothetical protein